MEEGATGITIGSEDGRINLTGRSRTRGAVLSVPCPFCGVGCKFDLSGRPLGPFCPKGLGAFEYYKRNIVTKPLLLEGDLYHEISLDEAAEKASEWIREKTYFVGSAEDTNESAWILQKLARYLGTNDIDHCGRVCHAASVEVYRTVFGVPLTDFKLGERPKEALIVGSDVAITYPVLWQEIRARAERIVVVDAWESFTMRQSTDSLIIPPGPGFAAFSEVVYSIEVGKEPEPWVNAWIEVEEVKELWKSLERPYLVHGMGVTQSGYGYQAILRLIQAIMMKGGKVMTLRGKVNVQGAGDMGLNPFPPLPPKELEELWGFPVPRERGHDLVQAFEYPYSTYLIHCQNVVASIPNSMEVTRKLNSSKVIQVTPKFTETSLFADLIVPSSPVIRTFGTVTRGDGMVYAITNGENLAFKFFKILAEYLNLSVEDVKETTEEAFSAIPYYRKIDVERLYYGEDQYLDKPSSWKRVEVSPIEVMVEHEVEGHWLYTARDPALWTTKGADPKSERRKMREAIYLNLEEFEGCKRAKLCSEFTGECIEGDAVTTTRVPKGVVIVFFNHVGLRINSLVPFEPRDPAGTPMYKAVRVKVKCLESEKR
ncbi:hypothetical protein IPA_07955 [Ignicoccus pacificus DSM 13166]|uniref:Molybdopterin oxidoreductase domain-containing protein n=1 Tax=Ignicoccus pacificus DSM 13166 TaxID=940294 RepID=A0A977KCN7_9CREN|nr:hypothetical protein IPA_07955 [Ignicoccus pacificus DSM 13166]